MFCLLMGPLYYLFIYFYFFGFLHALSDRETTYLLTLLSLIEELEFRLGRRNFHCWCLSLSKGFSYTSFFNWLLNPSLHCESISPHLWELKVPKKLEFFT